jgi:hypothetical protein
MKVPEFRVDDLFWCFVVRWLVYTGMLINDRIRLLKDKGSMV